MGETGGAPLTSGAHARQLTGASWNSRPPKVTVQALVLGFHTRMLQSSLPAPARKETAAPTTVCNNTQLHATSPVTTVLPLPLNVPQVTDPVCPANTAITDALSPVACHIHAVASLLPASNTLPAVERTMHVTPSPHPTMTMPLARLTFRVPLQPLHIAGRALQRVCQRPVRRCARVGGWQYRLCS